MKRLQALLMDRVFQKLLCKEIVLKFNMNVSAPNVKGQGHEILYLWVLVPFLTIPTNPKRHGTI